MELLLMKPPTGQHLMTTTRARHQAIPPSLKSGSFADSLLLVAPSCNKMVCIQPNQPLYYTNFFFNKNIVYKNTEAQIC